MTSADKEAQQLLDDLLLSDALNQDEDIPEDLANNILSDIQDIAEGEKSGRGEALVLVGERWSINVKGTTWAMLKAIVSLGLALMAAPAGLTKAAAAKHAWDLIQDLKENLKKLNESEKYVAQAIAAQGGQHWRQAGTPGVSLEYIERHFTDQGQAAPRGLKAIVDALVAKKVVETVSADDGKTYRIAF
ncbi:MAG: hypothetical protein QNJ20_13635 [Paracoccaceae bacterium]|nr:hypothetical protein [Paracoccaceae bacterium]